MVDTPDDVVGSASSVISDSLKIYGSVFLAFFGTYVIVRPKYPLAYNFCNSVREYNTKLARNHYGHIQWMWKIFCHTDDDLFENCGLTATTFLRFLRLGLKISLIGIFNSIFLIPVNYYGCNVDADFISVNPNASVVCTNITDSVEKIGLGHVSEGSNYLIAPVMAAYVMVVSTLWLIYKEFVWFTATRHKFLAMARPDNYSVYVAHIPEKYRGDEALAEYFRSIFEPSEVLEANVALDISGLESKVAQREKTMDKLEGAINIRNIKGYEPTLRTKLGEKKESIPFFKNELETINQEINEIVSGIENTKAEEQVRVRTEMSKKDTEANQTDFNVDDKSPLMSPEESKGDRMNRFTLTSLVDGVKKSTTALGSGLKQIGEMAGDLVSGSADGKLRDGGFVTFTTLTAKSTCLQMIHHATPFVFQVTEAPLPQHIFWNNVGLTHQKQQVTYVIAQLFTVALCLFWTIPVVFVSSLSKVESLKELIPGLDDAVVKYPWLTPLLEQLNPVLLSVLKALLPVILGKFCTLEGHVSTSKLNASLLTKLALFLIIQIFFVPAISGAVFESLPIIVEQPTKIISLLAASVPNQVSSFIQFVIVNVLIGCALEITRLVTIIKAYIRRYVGPRLTEKERNKVFFGLAPLTEPEEVDSFPLSFAEIILYMVFLLVYSCIAPIMSYIMFAAFGVMLLIFQNQFIYIYDPTGDEGGAIWSKFVKIMLASVLMSEIVLIGILSLNKSVLSLILMIPLVIGTVLFMIYIGQEHYKVIDQLPSTIGKLEDEKNDRTLNKAFLRGQYLQPALKAKLELSDTSFHELFLGGTDGEIELYYGTPEGSVNDNPLDNKV